jgi:ribonucleotide reductase alpha subunit
MLTVKKRDGTFEEASFDKITRRIKYLVQGNIDKGVSVGEPLSISYGDLAKDVVNSVVDGIKTSDLDEYAARLCASLVVKNYEYAILAGRIAVSNHHKKTLSSFTDTMKLLYENKDSEGLPAPLLNKLFYKMTQRFSSELESYIDYSRDYLLDYFGFKTLEHSYLLMRRDGLGVVERPQHMYLRVALAIHGENLAKVKETYDYLSLGYFTHASPTMFNAGTMCQQMSSCFLLGIGDSMDDEGGIPDCWKTCSKISKRAGGIGIGITPIRSEGSLIRGTNGYSSGIVPMLRVFNDIARYVNQGGRRNGSFAMYLEPWHGDIMDFLQLRKTQGKEERRTRDLFTALWIPDLFMKRVAASYEKTDNTVMWSLFCSDRFSNLYNIYGDEFETEYLKLEREGRYIKQLPVLDVWRAILSSQKETGTPYMLYKDSVNRKNNQSNLGVIRNSNLCAEIVEYSDEKEFAVCNLASISLNKFVEGDSYNFDKLRAVTRVALRNLNRVIDFNYYPVPETRLSNLRHRPVGLGIQGLADVFALLKIPFESPEAQRLNAEIAETIYFSCMEESCLLAEERAHQLEYLHSSRDNLIFRDNGLICYSKPGLPEEEAQRIQNDINLYKPVKEEIYRDSHIGSYSTYIGSEISKGLLQQDLWNRDWERAGVSRRAHVSGKWDWVALREKIAKWGVRNSLTTALMPTASTAQILGNNECFEPPTYNLYTRRVLSGEFPVINKYLQRDLVSLGLWTPEMQEKLVRYRGSIQKIMEIPESVRNLYKTSFEIKQRDLIELSLGRAPYVDQTQSLNIFVSQPNDNVLTSMHLYGWKNGLKTGMYYLRREQIKDAIQFTVKKHDDSDEKTGEKPSSESEADCLACSA